MSDPLADWPAAWDGVAETVVTTPGPDGAWNVAALGVRAPGDGERQDDGGGPEDEDGTSARVTARTWGRTRTRRNFAERADGYVQFTRDPLDFVEAACDVREEPEPVLDSADAWARVTPERVDAGETDGTPWADWALAVEESTVERRVVPVVSRAHAAVVEATVAASRLDAPGYEPEVLRARIRDAESVVERAGGDRHRAAWARFEALVDWRAK